MKKVLVTVLFLGLSQFSNAAFNECIGVYVGRISVNSQAGVDKVVLLETADRSSGSYWVNFSGWDRDAKKEALSILMAAKASQHRVDVYTFADDQCSVGSPGQTFKEIHYSTKP